jgi:YidC/Oxa1 family membrane protein insertase
MDRKSIIILVISVALLFLWPFLTNKLFPPVPKSTNQMTLSTNVSTNAIGVATNQATLQTNQPSAVVAEQQPLVTASTPEELVVVDTKDTLFRFTSYGGGLIAAELKNFPATIKCNDKQVSPTNRVTLNAGASVPVMALLGSAALQGDGVYQLAKTENGVRAEKALPNGLKVTKNFSFGSNYLTTVTLRIDNTSAQPIELPTNEVAIGTAAALGAHDDPTRLGIYWYDGNKKYGVDEAWFDNKSLGCIPGTPRGHYMEGNNNVRWGEAHSQFFTLAVMPKEPVTQIHVVRTNILAQINVAPLPGRPAPPPNGLRATLVYAPAVLQPGQTVERQFTIYAGPKEYRRLVNIGAEMKNNLDLIMDYGGFWGWFAQVLLSSMNGLHSLGLNYALAIIVITVIIKLLFWPLTNASTKSMKRMAALQPQMKELQEKYKDDPAKMNRKLMEFMKEHKVSPLGGCLPMLLQIPVFFGFFRMIQSAIELRGAQFLWVCDLSKPDTIFEIGGFPVNPLPLIMGATMLWQARLTPPSPGMDPVQQKIMKYMPLMFLFILYKFSSGLTLYWTVQNLLTIAQMKLTKAKDEPGATAAKHPAPMPKKKK